MSQTETRLLEEPELVKRYTVGGAYKWFVVGKRSRSIMSDESFFEGEKSKAESHFNHVHGIWKKQHTPAAIS